MLSSDMHSVTAIAVCNLCCLYIFALRRYISQFGELNFAHTYKGVVFVKVCSLISYRTVSNCGLGQFMTV